jgi:hypothetical protein
MAAHNENFLTLLQDDAAFPKICWITCLCYAEPGDAAYGVHSEIVRVSRLADIDLAKNWEKRLKTFGLSDLPYQEWLETFQKEVHRFAWRKNQSEAQTISDCRVSADGKEFSVTDLGESSDSHKSKKSKIKRFEEKKSATCSRESSPLEAAFLSERIGKINAAVDAAKIPGKYSPEDIRKIAVLLHATPWAGGTKEEKCRRAECIRIVNPLLMENSALRPSVYRYLHKIANHLNQPNS